MKSWIAVLCLLPGLAFSQVQSNDEKATDAPQALTEFDSAAQQALFKELTHELRCPKCQNQNIADSHAVVAVDMRNKTLELLKQGKNKDDVLAYMKSRYGDFVHYQPPVNRSTLVLWAVPVVMLLVLLLSVFWRRRGRTADSAAQTPDAAEQQLDQLIAQYRRKP
ncbi:cytochrome c-type biogenesis protein [Rheinheimera sp.]|uniref:cytochrome c-type biogenesis protein n=1 Tax=Rheinheimera sp. TaxID=1869214 RepID=UPI003AF92A8E